MKCVWIKLYAVWIFIQDNLKEVGMRATNELFRMLLITVKVEWWIDGMLVYYHHFYIYLKMALLKCLSKNVEHSGLRAYLPWGGNRNMFKYLWIFTETSSVFPHSRKLWETDWERNVFHLYMKHHVLIYSDMKGRTKCIHVIPRPCNFYHSKFLQK